MLRRRCNETRTSQGLNHTGDQRREHEGQGHHRDSLPGRHYHDGDGRMKQDNRLLPTEDELPEWAESDLPWRDHSFDELMHRRMIDDRYNQSH